MGDLNVNQDSRSVVSMEIRESHSSSCGLFFKVKRHLYSGQSDFQKIDVFENETFGNVLLLDGLVQTSERDEYFYHEMLVHPAFVSHSSPETCLIIGGGDGGTLSQILKYPVQKVRLVEIDDRVIEVCRKHFPWLDETLKDTRAELVVADGNEFIERTGMKYDVVLIDSSDPVGPSLSLHEQEFYQKVKKSLNPGGIIVAQVGSPIYHLDSLKKKARLFKDVYPIVHFYLGPVPTYPGGTWCYVYLSEKTLPLGMMQTPPAGLKYYNSDIHHAAFALPNFMQELGIDQ